MLCGCLGDGVLMRVDEWCDEVDGEVDDDEVEC